VLPRVVDSFQVLPNVAMCCQVLPSLAKSYQMLPNIAKCCHMFQFSILKCQKQSKFFKTTKKEMFLVIFKGKQ